MKIAINGAPVETGDARSIEELIQRQALSAETTLVEINGVALHRREWPSRLLQENDRIEMLRVAAGG
jgi:thiamine biosynthesis protein ThiS